MGKRLTAVTDARVFVTNADLISTNALIIAFSIKEFVSEQSSTGKASSFEKAIEITAEEHKVEKTADKSDCQVRLSWKTGAQFSHLRCIIHLDEFQRAMSRFCLVRDVFIS